MNVISNKLFAVTLVAVLVTLGILCSPVARTRQVSSDDDQDSPKLVVKKNFIHQMAALPETALYTPSTDGVFRVTAYLTTAPQPFSPAQDRCGFAWTDEFRTNDGPFGGASFFVTGGPDNPGGGEGIGSFSILIHAKAGKPITVLVNGGGSDLLVAPYDLFVTIEAL
jgi:hypothetical protein